MNGRSRKLLPKTTRLTAIMGLAPYLSIALPIIGPVRLPTAMNDSEALMAVRGQAKERSRGSTNSPNA